MLLKSKVYQEISKILTAFMWQLTIQQHQIVSLRNDTKFHEQLQPLLPKKFRTFLPILIAIAIAVSID